MLNEELKLGITSRRFENFGIWRFLDILWNLKVKKGPVTARSAEERLEKQSNITYHKHKAYETEEAGDDQITISLLKKRKITYCKPLHKGFTIFELSKLFIKKTHYIKKFNHNVEKNKTPKKTIH